MSSKAPNWVAEASESGDVIEVLNNEGGDGTAVLYLCPGCGSHHLLILEGSPRVMNTAADTGARWTWNGDKKKPSLTPSVRVSYPMVTTRKHQPKTTCHHWIKNGVAEMCEDHPGDKSGRKLKLDRVG